MIATGLTFLLGAVVTGLLALLIAPLIWRRAQRMARREFEATIPTTANEIRAEFDQVRAEAALSIRRGEIIAAEIREKSARTQAELGRSTIENVKLLKRNRALMATAAEREAQSKGIDDALGVKDDEVAGLQKRLGASEREAELAHEELEALGQRFQELTEIAEERQVQLIAAEARMDGFSDQIRAKERATRDALATAERLRTDVAQRQARQEKSSAVALNERLTVLLAGIADRDEEIRRLKDEMKRAADLGRGTAGSGPEQPSVPAALPPKPRQAESAASASPSRKRSAWGAKSGIEATDPLALAAERRLKTARGHRLAATEASEAEVSDMRETIADIAARVIRMSAIAEGPNSPIEAMLAAPEGERREMSGGHPPSLAERVRRIVQAERSGEEGSDRRKA